MSLTPPSGRAGTISPASPVAPASPHHPASARHRIIELDHVHRMARALTSDHQCQPAEGQSADGALIGNMHLQEAQPGLFMRLNRVRKRADLMIRSSVEPSLKIAVVWRGEPRVSFGPQCHALKPGRALCIALDEPTEFRLNSLKGAHEHSAILTLTPAWLKWHLNVSRASEVMSHMRHLAHFHWWPSPRLLERLDTFSRQRPTSPTQRLGIESLALEVISECLAARPTQTDDTTRHPPQETADWKETLEDWIHNGEVAYLSQAEIAARLGMSVRQLQRRYRDAYGQTMTQDLRRRQLIRAAHLLQDRKLTVEAAAEMAGYRSAANFATAFRRQFGVPPSQRPVVTT
ncbi:AraC family transcriptional regulator [Cobetia sp. MB87]|uniref:helix-turn-helix transcriptional regulator n=1 Tax=Cobetia sp. MB87 TaxID=2588451 RepID=UPI001407A4E4|nr:AraC family transcriptional regulator [Cobetia sp. MB87]NHH85178.1 Multiple antibiotic resistance protein MarA [Cobetia sp. MB87]